MMRSCHECLPAKKREWSCSGGRYSHRKRYGMMRLRRRMVLSSCCMKIYRVDLTGMRRMQGTYMYRTCKRQMPQGEKIRGKRGRACGICKRGRGNGALGGDRTHNPCLRRAVLYPLSYERVALNVFREGIIARPENDAGSILPHLRGPRCSFDKEVCQNRIVYQIMPLRARGGFFAKYFLMPLRMALAMLS